MRNKIIDWAIAFLFSLPSVALAQSPLCSSYPTSFCCEYVASVTINGQTYAGSNGYTAGSGGTGPNGYYDYTGGTAVPTINAGQNITISYTAQTNSNYMEYFKLWVDFNGNGVLSDPGEQVYAYNVSWSGTKTVNATFQVPTTVFNGQVYMRFMMVYANVPALCGSYAYGNTFDFVTTITGAVDPFNHSGYVYGANGIGVPSVPVKLYKKLTSASTYSLHDTYNTDANGAYSISTTLDATLYDFQIVVDNLTISTPAVSDALYFNQRVLNQNFTSKDYYRMNTNSDANLAIADVYNIYKKMVGVNWIAGVPSYRLFTQTQWSTINSSTNNLTGTYPGVQSLTIQSPLKGGTTNLYLIRTGHAN